MLVRVRARFACALARSAFVRCFLISIFRNFVLVYCFLKKKVYICAVNQLNFCFMSTKSSGASLGENKPCGSTPICRLITHFRLMRDEKNCVIPLTETEFEILIVALEDFKMIHTAARIDYPFSEKGAAIVDSLSYHLKDYYNTFIR